MSPIPGAIACTAALFALYALIATVHDWWCKARLWDRLERTCGGPGSGLKILLAAEASEAAVMDVIAKRGVKTAKRYGWLPEGWL